MGFRQNNETNRKWNAFYQANKELIERIGLPGPTVDTWDRFADLLMHDVIDNHDDPTHFSIDELNLEKRELFKELIERYFQAGFSDPGMGHWLVGGIGEWVKLVNRYPSCFHPRTVQHAKEWYADREDVQA